MVVRIQHCREKEGGKEKGGWRWMFDTGFSDGFTGI